MAKNKPRNSKRQKRPRLPRAKARLLFTGAMAALLILVLMAKLIDVGIVKGPEYSQKAQKQWQSTVSLQADRGEILDRNGNVLAESYTTYQVNANPISIDEEDRERVANILATLLNLDFDTVHEKLNKRSKVTGQLYSQVKIKDQVEANVVTQLNSYQLGRGVSFYADVKRNYPEGELFAQLLGFTDIDGNGQSGMELSYNSALKGQNGKQIVQTDRDGNAIVGAAGEYTQPIHGATVYTTLDTAAENFLEAALQEAMAVTQAKSVYGILLDPVSGEIYAVGSYPSFNPNTPPRNDFATLLELSKQRMVTDTHEPGDLFKLLTLATALDGQTVNSYTSFRCKSKLLIDGTAFSCTLPKGHGQQTLQAALNNGCRESFMSMALELGVDAFYEKLYTFGLWDSSSSGLTGETKGTISHKKYIRQPELAALGCGEGLSTTAMQLCRALMACINGGELLEPYYISNVLDPNQQSLESHRKTVTDTVISPETSRLIKDMLESYVLESNRSYAIPEYSVGGFGGTSRKFDDKKNVQKELVFVSGFAFAPVKDPKYLCMMVIDEPKLPVSLCNELAAPYVQQVLSKMLTYYGVNPDKNDRAISVPNLAGMTVEQAKEALESLGLKAVYVEGEQSAMVQRQSPSVGNVVVNGSKVLLYTAWTSLKGEETQVEMVKMPKVLGKNRLDAMDALIKAGLVMDYDRANSAGTAITAQFEEGQELPKGTSVHVEFYVEVKE